MPQPSSDRKKRIFFSVIVAVLILSGLCIFVFCVAVALFELQTSWFQARFFSSKAGRATYSIEAGANPAPCFPDNGPYDARLGYSRLGSMLQKAEEAGFEVESQARVSGDFRALVNSGFFAPYREKNQAGLVLLDSRGSKILDNAYPRKIYPSFDSIPPVVRDTLLYIENRELLSERIPFMNPAVEWDRFVISLKDLVLRTLGSKRKIQGASTLSTQIEKFRHSPEGRTSTLRDKYRQMYSASLRAYLDGPNTTLRRREIVTDFINSIPLAAINGYGEVTGLHDGMWAWYGTDLDEYGELLRADPGSLDKEGLAKKAEVYRQILSLFLSQRRPSYYLASGSGQDVILPA